MGQIKIVVVVVDGYYVIVQFVTSLSISGFFVPATSVRCVSRFIAMTSPTCQWCAAMSATAGFIQVRFSILS